MIFKYEEILVKEPYSSNMGNVRFTPAATLMIAGAFLPVSEDF